MRGIAVLAAITAVAIAACGTTGPAENIEESGTPADAGLPTPAGDPSEPPSVETPRGEPGDIPGTIDPALRALVEQAIDDLASRLRIDRSAIEVIAAELVVWPDTSLGCPQPGMSYLQVLTNGARIELAAGGVGYEYHTGGSEDVPFLCVSEGDRSPVAVLPSRRTVWPRERQTIRVRRRSA